jgi:hypothetical protein
MTEYQPDYEPDDTVELNIRGVLAEDPDGHVMAEDERGQLPMFDDNHYRERGTRRDPEP